jgi:hypothetical protein
MTAEGTRILRPNPYSSTEKAIVLAEPLLLCNRREESTQMRIFTPLPLLSTLATMVFLAACSGSTATAPKPASPQGGAVLRIGRVSSVFNTFGQLNINTQAGRHLKSYYACPAKGQIVYVSDTNMVNVFAGNFAGQHPCGRLTSGVQTPYGLYVQPTTHDLYVSDPDGASVIVFHRGQTTPYNIYNDPITRQYPGDVAIADDGTLIVADRQSMGVGGVDISTWIGGPNGGTFVGDFLMTNAALGAFVTVGKNGIVYYDDVDATTGKVLLWSVSCPLGACGAQTQIAGVSFNYPGGLASDGTSDLLAVDTSGLVEPGTADTFELPNPSPKAFSLPSVAVGISIDKVNKHWFVAEPFLNISAEYMYPSGKLVGAVRGSLHGYQYGIAVDP